MQRKTYEIYARRPALLAAWERNQAAIESAIRLYNEARRLEIVALRDGTKIVVKRGDYDSFSIARVLR